MLMKNMKKSRISLLMSVLSLLISAWSLSFIPLAEKTQESTGNLFGIIIATVFWVGFLVALFFTWQTKKLLKKYCEKLVNNKHLKEQKLPGILTFSSNWKMLMLYLLILIGMVFIVADIFWNFVSELIMFPIISITTSAFALHCVLDGKYFKTYNLIKESVNHEKIEKA